MVKKNRIVLQKKFESESYNSYFINTIVYGKYMICYYRVVNELKAYSNSIYNTLRETLEFNYNNKNNYRDLGAV